MATKIIHEGATQYRTACGECAAVFTYEREDVHRNYVTGGDDVACPSCGHAVRHRGALNAAVRGGPCRT
jgi:hypothetical protein